MMPWMVPFLRFSDDSLKSTFQEQLSLMRKNRLFCDVILQVENTEIPAHRNVLACVSPYLMELFSAEQNTCNDGNIPSYRLNGYITREGLSILVDYAYTAQLEVPEDMIKDVYLAAWQLRMERVVNECAAHLVSDLSSETSIETRSLPGINRNKNFVNKVDQYIAEHFKELTQTTSFLQLPSIQIEVLHQTKQEMTTMMEWAEDSMCRLVLEWIKREINDHSASIASLSERSHMLFLASDNSLQDVSDLIGDKANSDLVKDYKKLALKIPGNNMKPRRKGVSQPERPRILLYSRDITDRTYDEETRGDADWNVIATIKLSDHTYVSLITLNGSLCRISIQLRLNVDVATTENQSNVTTPSPIPTERSNSFEGCKEIGEKSVVATTTEEQPELFCEVANMSESKCGLGAAEHDGKLIVVGGYGRTECLKSVESYCPITNKWTEELSLNEARGRVQITIIDNTVYAVGGSNGVNELDTVECLALNKEEVKKKWKKCAKLPFPRSNAGICALDGKIYCVGGNSTGQNGIRQCDVFDPETNKWNSIAPLNNGRCQAGVVAYNGKLWAAGGSDAWNCLNSVEVYDPEEDTWTFIAPLLTARRGCGLAVLNGKIYCIGGSDGSQSLKTTEYFDEASQSWVLGASLITARSNVSVAVIQNRLYAVGGFSGKKFLNTIEYFDQESNEWSKFAKLQSTASSGTDDKASSLDGDQNDEKHFSEGEDKSDFEREMINSNEIEVNPSKQKVAFKVSSEKEKIREDESESTTIIMPIS